MKRIVRPEPNEYTVWTLSVMAAAVAVKIVIGLYTLRRGKRLESGALKASGKDALNDAGADRAGIPRSQGQRPRESLLRIARRGVDPGLFCRAFAFANFFLVSAGTL